MPDNLGVNLQIARKQKLIRPFHWVWLLACAAAYVALMLLIIWYLQTQMNGSLPAESGYVWPGILAQGQVLAVLLIALNPIRAGRWIGVGLCGVSALLTLQRVVLIGAFYALPGVLIPSIAIAMIELIYRFKERSRKSGEALTLSNELLQKVLDTIPMPIFWKDLHSNFLGCNQVFAVEAGKNSPEELIGKDDTSTPSSDQTEKYRADDAEIIRSGVGKINIEEPHSTASGEPGWIRTTKVPLRNASGEIFGLLGVFEDITKKKIAEQELYYEKERLRVTLLSIGDAVITTDSNKTITLINSVAEQLTGWRAKDAMGKEINLVLRLESETPGRKASNPVDEAIGKRRTVTLANHTRVISRQGRKRIIEDSAAPIFSNDGEVLGAVMVFRDVTDKKRKQDEILYLSYHDSLTGLYNRRYVEERILKIEEMESYPLTVILGDINGLKMVNDVLGRSEGDRVLIEGSKILLSACRPEDIVARWGGDEFIILLPGADATEAQQVCQTIRDGCVKLAAEHVNLSISLGYAVRRDDAEAVAKTIHAAEEGMYTQKLLSSHSYRSAILESLRKTLFEKSHETEEHAHRLMRLCRRMGEAMDLPQTMLQELELLGVMHDVGKIGVPDSILNKPGKLTEDEWVLMKKHAEIGCRITQSIPEFVRVSDYILSHHEKWDGSGYPRGLKGEAIPLPARILCIMDAYDAMTSDRAYRKPLSQEDALRELEDNAGTQFDPALVRLFLDQKLYEGSEDNA